ncbi:MAG: S49 family peptidase, partial [Candidatus Aminicenantales bacterium]
LLKEELLWIYEQFLTRAAEGRGLTRDAVDAVGKGRIWTGRQAKDLKLVDEIGGLTMAIGLAKKEAGISADEDVRLDVWPRKRTLWQSLMGRPGLSLDLKSATGREKILETARMMNQTKIWAIMPFWVKPQ